MNVNALSKILILSFWIVIAFVSAETNVCVVCGKNLTPFARPLTNVCVVVLDDVPTLTVKVPVCLLRPFDVAVTKACVPPSVLTPTLTSNVLVVTLVTFNHASFAGSVARG